MESPGWNTTASKDRVYEFVTWEHDTIQPKYGINLGVEYTHTLGVAEIYDYEWYFNGFPWKIHDPRSPSCWESSWRRRWCISLGGLTTCGTRVFHSSLLAWWVERRKSWLCLFHVRERADLSRFGPFKNPNGGKEAEKNWIDTEDFRVLRNLKSFPALGLFTTPRATLPFTGLSPETRKEAMEEILYAADPIWTWRDDSHRAYDPRRLAWVGQ